MNRPPTDVPVKSHRRSNLTVVPTALYSRGVSAGLDDTQQAPPPAASDRTASLPASVKPSDVGRELPAGLRLGHFRIDRKLGAGGMGEVYLATDLALDRPVAVKVLPEGTASGSARERLIREARAQARVHHPNVAHIYFIGEEEGRLYFAMEHVSGQTLAERVSENPLPVQEALEIIRSAVLGLREAQRSGFTHRDVKPSNMMLDAHGMLKVLDFGLAAGAPEAATDGPVAQTTLAGTPLYMAPEQAHGDPIDFRADIYALGATLYHLVSGRPPFQADSIAELVTLHETAARPALPRGANPRTAITAIDALIARMMAPKPADRFASYDELLHAIELASLQHTRPAGFWVRSIATFVDLSLVAVVVGITRGIATGQGDVNLGSVVPLLAILLYTLTIARWGTTPGKALLELEVVAVATSRRPRWTQALAREVLLGFLPVAIITMELANDLLDLEIPNELLGLAALLAALLLIVNLAYASNRIPGKRAMWDRRSGTMVRYRTARSRF